MFEQAQPTFDQSQVLAAASAVNNMFAQGAIVDNGLTPVASGNVRQPIAWVDSLGQVWPHEAGSAVHFGLNYLYTREEVARAMHQQKHGIITVSTMPAGVVPQVTGEAPIPTLPVDAAQLSASMAADRLTMLNAFANTHGTKA